MICEYVCIAFMAQYLAEGQHHVPRLHLEWMETRPLRPCRSKQAQAPCTLQSNSYGPRRRALQAGEDP